MPIMQFTLKYQKLLLIIVSVLLFASCGTSKRVYRNLKPIQELKLIRRIEKNIPTYTTYSSKKMTVNLNSNGQKFAFTSQFYINRNEEMFISLKKIGVPIGRALVTPDSLKIINYYDRNYMLEDVSSIQEIIGINLSYKMAQALLTADVTTILEADVFDKELISKVDSQMYKLETIFDIKIEKALEKENEKRLQRYFKYLDEESFIKYHLWIDPDFFVTRRLEIEDVRLRQRLSIYFDEYELVGRDLFPQNITIVYTSPSQNVRAELKLSKPTFNGDESYNFNIPEKYQRATFKTQ